MQAKSLQSCPTLCDSMDCNAPGKNTGGGCHALLQGILPTQGWNIPWTSCIGRWGLYHQHHLLSPTLCLLRANFFSHVDVGTLWAVALTHWKRPWCWGRLKGGGEGGNRKWDGWMASPTLWTWVWASFRSWWTRKPGVLQSMGSQRVRHNWATELNWTVAHQVPLSMGFPKQEYRSGFPRSPPGDLPDPGIEPVSLMSPALIGRFFTTSASRKPLSDCKLHSVHLPMYVAESTNTHICQFHLDYRLCPLTSLLKNYLPDVSCILHTALQNGRRFASLRCWGFHYESFLHSSVASKDALNRMWVHSYGENTHP